MEDEISDAIYGDLGDFEYNEKLKEQGEEIACLTNRLRESEVAKGDLQREIKKLNKDYRTLQKNASSLYLTAKVELNRKKRDISLLQQKIDNRIFRRPNNFSIAVQTDSDVTTDTLSHYNANNNNENMPEQSIGDRYMRKNSEPFNKSNNTRADFNKFRIPKKNPYARHENNGEPKNQLIHCNERDMEYSQDQPKHHLPKKNPHARCLDSEQSNEIHVSRSEWKEIDGEKTSFADRQNKVTDNRRRSPFKHTSSRNEDYKRVNFGDQKRDSRRNNRKHSLDRNSTNENDRHPKRYRSDSTSNRNRSRSSRNEDTRSRTKSPKKSKHDQLDDVISAKDCKLKEKDLEAMLIVRKKILNQIDSKDSEPKLGLAENSSKECHRKSLNNVDDPAKKSSNVTGAKVANVMVIDESDIGIVINQKKSNGFDDSPGNSSNSYQEPPSVDIAAPAKNFKPFSPLRELMTSIQEPPKSTNPKVVIDEADAPTNKPKPLIEKPSKSTNPEINSEETTASTNQSKPFSPLRELMSSIEEPSSSTNPKVFIEEATAPTNKSKPLIEKPSKSTNSQINSEETTASTNQSKPFSPLRELMSSIEEPSSSTNPKVFIKEATAPTNKSKPFSPLRELIVSSEDSSKSTNPKVNSGEILAPANRPKPFSPLRELNSSIENPSKSTNLKVDTMEAAAPSNESEPFSPLRGLRTSIEEPSKSTNPKVNPEESVEPTNQSKPFSPLKKMSSSIEKPSKSPKPKVMIEEVAALANTSKPFSPLKKLNSSIEEPSKSTNPEVNPEGTIAPTNQSKPFSPLRKLISSPEKPSKSIDVRADTEEATPTANNLKSFSGFNELASSVKEPTELTNVNVDRGKMTKTNHLQNNENSNSQMDLDYELMQRTSSENETNLSCEEKNGKLLEGESIQAISPIVNNDIISGTPPSQINASSVENAVQDDSLNETTLNSSHERHMLSKNAEYTVQDVGHEILIFLTKKRKKNRNAKITIL